MLTPAEREALERAIGERLGRAQSVVASLEGRRLASEDDAVLSQIRTFIGQAEEAKRTDLLRANNLAERAEVLANDLAKRVR
jgi:hypothetical protein